MNHPSVAYIDNNSAPRILFSGDRLIEVDMPVGTRVLYPNPPLKPLKDIDAAIRYAINHPHNSDPLYAKLWPGMRVFIAIDDLSLPLPPMKRPDIRQRVLTIVLQLLADHGVSDFEMAIATALHRRMKPEEIRHIVGDKIFDAYYPKRLYNTDPEAPDALEYIGDTEKGERVELLKRAVTADLIIYVNLNLVPMDGGHKSVAVGLAGYKSIRDHHSPHVIRKCHSYMDPENSELNNSIVRMGRLANKELNIFTIETTINTKMFDDPLSFLAKNEDHYTKAEKLAAKSLIYTLDRLPQKARQFIFQKVPSPYGVTGVNAGETEAVHKHTLKRSFEQYAVPVEGQADIMITGIPYISPYNVNSFLNPILLQVMAQGYIFNMYRGAPLVKKGGTLIITHPCTDYFDPEQHAPYIEFFHRILPESKDGRVLRKYEEEFASNPAYIEMYRFGYAYHPAHPFFMWYWGEAGRAHLGRTIVVGADNNYVPELLGYEVASSMDEAIEMAKDTAPPNPEISLFHLPPILIADVTP